jgi:hypothetical protein
MNKNAPNFIERIVCLANSRKSAGRCVAGKRMEDGSWLRPISARSTHELSELDQRYPNGESAQLLDVIEIPCVEEKPFEYQSENVLIDHRFYWERKGCASWQDVLALIDQDADLWANGFSAYRNLNNRVPEERIDPKGGSLRLIYIASCRPQSARIRQHENHCAGQFRISWAEIQIGFDRSIT